MYNKALYATEAQLKYLDDLVAKNDVPLELEEYYGVARPSLTIKEASELIDAAKKCPTKQDAAQGVKKEQIEQLIGALGAVPNSKYAIPVEEVMSDLLDDQIHGDLIFLEVKEYIKKPHMKKLIGSVGSFTRVQVPVRDALTFVSIISKDPYKYTRIFAEHYQCCGKCGAELTDPKSREVMLGPDCRRVFGK